MGSVFRHGMGSRFDVKMETGSISAVCLAGLNSHHRSGFMHRFFAAFLAIIDGFSRNLQGIEMTGDD